MMFTRCLKRIDWSPWFESNQTFSWTNQCFNDSFTLLRKHKTNHQLGLLQQTKDTKNKWFISSLFVCVQVLFHLLPPNYIKWSAISQTLLPPAGLKCKCPKTNTFTLKNKNTNYLYLLTYLLCECAYFIFRSPFTCLHVSVLRGHDDVTREVIEFTNTTMQS